MAINRWLPLWKQRKSVSAGLNWPAMPKQDSFSICGETSVNLSTAACYSIIQAGNCLRWSQDDAVILQEAWSAPIRLCCHYSAVITQTDRMASPLSVHLNPGTNDESCRVEGQGCTSLILWGVSINPIPQPTHRSAGSCLLCISRCGLNLGKPAKTRSISALIWKYPHSSRTRLCQFDFDSFLNMECSILESGCL